MIVFLTKENYDSTHSAFWKQQSIRLAKAADGFVNAPPNSPIRLSPFDSS
jgi:hypothetical protein